MTAGFNAGERSMRVHGIGHTDTGKQRTQNEDSFLVDDDLGLYVVSDGMGGHAAGEIASALAVAAVEGVVRERSAALDAAREGGLAQEELASIARAAVQAAARQVYHRATSPEGDAGMGCTLTVLLVAGSGAAMAHVGDSRLFLSRDGKMSQLSMDHTLAQELVRAGAFKPEDVRAHPYAHVLSRSVGTQPAVQVDTLEFDVLPGDRLVLCTDGLSEYVEDPAWLAAQIRDRSFDTLAEKLVSHANEAGGKDNITVLLVDYMD
jgi:serine/threonine protein phosphatase PrpC